MVGIVLLKNGSVFAPNPLGKKDILVAGGMIVAIEDSIELPSKLYVKVIDCTDLIITPGLIDCHAHIAGAGGEGGPKTRTPELPLSEMLKGGITGVIGCLGTDGMTRSVESVLMKAKALREEGVSAWILTGAYQVATISITGDIARDICVIEECIGVGEVAVSDHRSSCPTDTELIRIAQHARVAGMLSGKAGIVNLHMGDMPEGKNHFQPIYNALCSSRLPITQFIPTHINRNEDIFEQAKEYGKMGGYLDITASSYPYYPQYETKPSKAIKLLMDAGVPLSNITISSDGGGSLPDFDAEGNLISLLVGDMASIYREMKEAVLQDGLAIELALQPVSSNVASIFKLKGKGNIKEGYDADILMLSSQDLSIKHLLSRGEVLIEDGVFTVLGTFEKR